MALVKWSYGNDGKLIADIKILDIKGFDTTPWSRQQKLASEAPTLRFYPAQNKNLLNYNVEQGSTHIGNDLVNEEVLDPRVFNINNNIFTDPWVKIHDDQFQNSFTGTASYTTLN